MIRQEIQNTLYQFKRVHKKQIAPKMPLLSPEMEEHIKRKNLKKMTNTELRSLLKNIIKQIDHYQQSRVKPHAGLLKFKDSLSLLIIR